MVTIFRNRYRRAYLLLALIAYSPILYARWATLSDTDFKFETIHHSIQVEAEGCYTETVELQAKILKESGKDKLVSIALPYNASNTTFEMVEAKTLVAGKDYPVDPQHIEDKPLASNVQGFDQTHQVLIAFPKIALNASIYIKFKRVVKEPAMAGFFDRHIDFGLNGYCEQGHFEIQSAIPLFIHIHDPEKIFENREFQKDKTFFFKASLKKPVFFNVIDENNPFLNETKVPWMRMATLKTWPDFAEKIAGPFEKVIQEPLPAYFKPVLEKARQHKNPIDQINAITSGLAESLTYMGDWRTVKGAYAPRSLSKIAETRFGDCKDFSAITVALLRQLGLKASAALVNRGIPRQEGIFVLPSFNNFNHAIVYVETASGIYWVDPTNFSSFAPNLYPDIADRPSLILLQHKARLANIPAIIPHRATATLSEKITLKPEGIIQSKGHLKLSGWHALDLTGAELKTSQDSIDLSIMRSITKENRLLHYKVQPYHLKSRIVKPLDFSFNYTAKNTMIKSSAGNAYLLSEDDSVRTILVKTAQRISDLYLGIPSVTHTELLLSDTRAIGNQFLNCHFKSPWFEGQRQIKDTPAGIKISDTKILLQSIVSNEALQSKAYQNLQADIYACFGDLALIYESTAPN